MKSTSASKHDTTTVPSVRIGLDPTGAHRNTNSQSRKDDRAFERAIRDLKVDFKTELAALKRKFDEQLRNERDYHKKTHEKQRLTIQREQEAMVKTRLKEALQNYSDLAADQRKELEKIRQMHNDYDSAMHKKDAEIVQLKLELAKSSADLQTRKIVMQLAERNAMIERLRSRIDELEEMVSQSRTEDEEMDSSGQDQPTGDYASEQGPGLFDEMDELQVEEKENADEGHLNFGGQVGEINDEHASAEHLSDVAPLESDNGQGKHGEPYDIEGLQEPRQSYAPSRARPFFSWLY